MQQRNSKMPGATVISTLLNPMHFLIQRVYIAREKENFRLIVFHHGRLLMDEQYSSVESAKLAFLKFWGYRAVSGGVYPEWSHFYNPEKKWLKWWYSSITERRFISLLVNSIYYFVETVIIVTEKKGYRLLVLHRGFLLTDEIHETVDEAKRRFLDLYGLRALRHNTKASWSYFYPPDPVWLKDRLKIMA